MLQLSPQTMRIVDYYADGEHARHFTFELVNFTQASSINIGQFFMLTVPGVGQAPFTYTSLPDKQGRFVALIRKVGKLTEALFKLIPGAVLGYNGPFGRGWPTDELSGKEVLIVAGGCGLAPLAASIDYLIERGQAGSTTVIYGANDRAAQVLCKERQHWCAELTMVETVMVKHQELRQGTPSEHIASIIAEHDRQAYIVLTCGPDIMMRSVAQTCMELGISSAQIWMSLERRMSCGIGQCGHCYLAHNYVCKQGPTYRFDELLALEAKGSQFTAHAG